MKLKNKLLSLVMSFIMTFSILICLPVNISAAEGYDLYYIYSDIQANKTSQDQRYGSNSNNVSQQVLPYTNGARTVYLAKNEYEGFQIYYYEKAEGKNLRVEITDFKNSSGEILESSIYNEFYICPYGTFQENLQLADALIPYNGEIIETQTNQNNTLYVELHSSKNQTAGFYSATVTIYDGEDVLTTNRINAYVWNFALPESHYSTFLTGLYNTASGYSATSNYLKLSGVRFQNGEVIPEDKDFAESILEGWYDYLLEYGVNAYELPRYLIDNDAKSAELLMANPKVKMFTVPLLSNSVNSANNLNSKASEMILKYKSVIDDNEILLDKAFFYPADEPSWTDEASANSYNLLNNAIKNLWGNNMHTMIPFYGTNNSFVLNKITETTDILCANQTALANSEECRNMFMSDSWHKRLRYQGDTWYGNSYLYSYGKSPKGVFCRILYWQAYATQSDGILHWNSCYIPTENGEPYDVFQTACLPAASGVYTGNGDGILMYPGATLGFDATIPIASLRLKQLSSGMDDYDYLMLAKEFLGEDSDIYTSAFNSVLPNFKTNGITGMLHSNGPIDWVAWECTTMNAARIKLGNALSNANTEHAFGEYNTVVLPDENHNGLEIRICADCGTQESRNTQKVTHSLGDVNLDGYVDADDYDFLRGYIDGDLSLNAEQMVISNLNLDREIDNFDLIWLSLFLNDKININGTGKGYLKGDINEDGNVTIEDYSIIKLYLSGELQLIDNSFYEADVNNDNTIDAFDLFSINKYINSCYNDIILK